MGKPKEVASKGKAKVEGECIIPGPIPREVLGKFNVKRDDSGALEIKEYVEWQAKGEKVIHVEKVTSERLHGRTLEAWDVHTNRNRWWVITNPTNLYLQKLFQSLDYLISFHVGLMERVSARRPHASDEQQQSFAAAWRRWEQAAEALDSADEAEDFQAVGMRCRECLLELIRSTNVDQMIPPGQEPPKMGDFIHRAEIIADNVAGGSSHEKIRSSMKATAKSAWELANWITHARNATRFDGEIAVDCTQNVLTVFTLAILRKKRGLPDRCPSCGSYQLRSIYNPELEVDPPYEVVCLKCGHALSPEGAQAFEPPESPASEAPK